MTQLRKNYIVISVSALDPEETAIPVERHHEQSQRHSLEELRDDEFQNVSHGCPKRCITMWFNVSRFTRRWGKVGHFFI
jgi:hypothetical protein